MKTYQTASSEAKTELNQLLGLESQFYQAGAYDNLSIEPLRLQTTYDEAKLLFFERSLVRPAFNFKQLKIEMAEGSTTEEESASSTNSEIIMPILFFKADGEDADFNKKIHEYRQKHNKEVIYYTSFNPLDYHPKKIDKIDESELMKRVEISHLSKAKKLLFCEAYQQLKIWHNEFNLEIQGEELMSTILDSKAIIDAFHHSSAEQTPAKLVINDNQKNSLGKYAIVRLLLAHSLAFDVAILSKNAYASIENIVGEQYYDHFIIDKVEKVTRTKKEIALSRLNLKWWNIALGIAVLVLLFKLLS